jgi:hypothetical protein
VPDFINFDTYVPPVVNQTSEGFTHGELLRHAHEATYGANRFRGFTYSEQLVLAGALKALIIYHPDQVNRLGADMREAVMLLHHEIEGVVQS